MSEDINDFSYLQSLVWVCYDLPPLWWHRCQIRLHVMDALVSSQSRENLDNLTRLDKICQRRTGNKHVKNVWNGWGKNPNVRNEHHRIRWTRNDPKNQRNFYTVLQSCYCKHMYKFALLVALECLSGIHQHWCVDSWGCPPSLDQLS